MVRNIGPYIWYMVKIEGGDLERDQGSKFGVSRKRYYERDAMI